jgi:hypothetical protein
MPGPWSFGICLYTTIFPSSRNCPGVVNRGYAALPFPSGCLYCPHWYPTQPSPIWSPPLFAQWLSSIHPPIFIFPGLAFQNYIHSTQHLHAHSTQHHTLLQLMPHTYFTFPHVWGNLSSKSTSTRMVWPLIHVPPSISHQSTVTQFSNCRLNSNCCHFVLINVFTSNCTLSNSQYANFGDFKSRIYGTSTSINEVKFLSGETILVYQFSPSLISSFKLMHTTL